MKIRFNLIITCLLLIFLIGTVPILAQDSDTVLEITDLPDGLPDAFDAFEQYVNVFGVHVVADERVDADKVLHAAGVLAQYLDNDQDGEVDNEDVLEEMLDFDATLFMFDDEDREMDEFFDQIERSFDPEDIAMQPLFGFETHPEGSRDEGRFDATLEEVLHLITYAGYSQAYPDVWGEEPDTEVANAMDIARGGFFERVPNRYPDDAWYTYYDRTCDYPCQITEYIYWSLTSLLGAQDFPGRLEEIEEEWRLNTPELVESQDPAIYDLLTDPIYAFPTTLPDGNYEIQD